MGTIKFVCYILKLSFYALIKSCEEETCQCLTCYLQLLLKVHLLPLIIPFFMSPSDVVSWFLHHYCAPLFLVIRKFPGALRSGTPSRSACLLNVPRTKWSDFQDEYSVVVVAAALPQFPSAVSDAGAARRSLGVGGEEETRVIISLPMR